MLGIGFIAERGTGSGTMDVHLKKWEAVDSASPSSTAS
jgi:hypothetical protein